MRRVGFRLANIIKVEAWPPELSRRVPNLLVNLPRLNFERLEAQLREIVDRARAVCQAEDYRLPRRQSHSILTVRGRRFELATSLAMLDEAGKWLQNCLRESDEMHEIYWSAFCDGEADFWILRSAENAILGTVEVRNQQITQAKGNGNSLLNNYLVDLKTLIQRADLDADNSDDLANISYWPSWAGRRPPDWDGMYQGTVVRLWIGDGQAIVRAGTRTRHYWRLDLAGACELIELHGCLEFACRNFGASEWTMEDLRCFLVHLASVAKPVAYRLFPLFQLAMSEGRARAGHEEDPEDF
jgi:hypothetical protein